MKTLFDPNKGTWVLMCFVLFFSIVVGVNVVFIRTALNTHSGVVTEQPYEKGLAFNTQLQEARLQPNLQQVASFENGVLRWSLKDDAGNPLDAEVSARLMRPVKSGYDFDVVLNKVDAGVYEVVLELPFKGQWKAQMRATWETSQYQKVLLFQAK